MKAFYLANEISPPQNNFRIKKHAFEIYLLLSKEQQQEDTFYDVSILENELASSPSLSENGGGGISGLNSVQFDEIFFFQIVIIQVDYIFSSNFVGN